MQPKVIIVILNWNGKEDTKECISSVKNIDYENYEIILIDNASTDGSAEYLQETFPDINIIKNNINSGYTGGNNIGIRYALDKGCDFVLLLNNDVIVDKNFLKELIDAAKADCNIGIIGSLIYYYKKKKINFGGGFVDKKTYEPLIRGYKKDDTGEFKTTEEIDYASGACLLAKIEVFKKIGFFNEDYFILWDETDLCFRAKKAGYKIIFQPRSFIWHKESTTFKSNESPRYIYYAIRNKLLFLNKNIPVSAILRFKTATNAIVTAARLIKRKKHCNNLVKAKACLRAVSDYYLGRFKKGPTFLYE